MKTKVKETDNRTAYYERREANFRSVLTWTKQAMMEKAGTIQIDHDLADIIAERIASNLPEDVELPPVAYTIPNREIPASRWLFGLIATLFYLIMIASFVKSCS